MATKYRLSVVHDYGTTTVTVEGGIETRHKKHRGFGIADSFDSYIQFLDDDGIKLEIRKNDYRRMYLEPIPTNEG